MTMLGAATIAPQSTSEFTSPVSNPDRSRIRRFAQEFAGTAP
jgi:hypothetical protein